MMKEILSAISFITVAVAAILWGCSKSVVIDENKRMMTKSDTSVVSSRDSTEMADTAKIPITFSVTVEGWEDTEIIWN